MIPLLRAEARKLLTIRSTYVLTALAFLLVIFLSFWVMGYKGSALNPAIAMDAVREGAAPIAIFFSIIAILLVTHEYRYNTIMYTLTAANSRSKVVFAKLAVMAAYTVAAIIVAFALAAIGALFGASLAFDQIAPQHFYFVETLWRTSFFILGYTLIAMVIALLFRHVVGAIATLFIVSTTVEGLLTLLLKENAKYLPFASLERVQTGMGLSPGKAAIVFSLYLIAGWIIAWVLFLRRDAN